MDDPGIADASQKLVDYVEDKYGKESQLFLYELEAHARDLTVPSRVTEARLLYPEIISLNEKLYGAESEQYHLIHNEYARALSLAGYPEEAAQANLTGFEAELADVLNCGRVTPGLILGCNNNEALFATSLGVLAGTLADAGRGEEVPALFDRVRGELETKWGQCGGPGWKFDCSEVPEDREHIDSAEADYFANHGMKARAAEIYQRIFASKAARFEPCLRENDRYCSNYRIRSAWRDLDGALDGLGRQEDRLGPLETIIRLSMSESGWLRRNGDSLSSDEQDEVKDIEAKLKTYASLASRLGARERGKAFLASVSQSDLFASTLGQESLKAQLEKLDKQADSMTRSSPEHLAVLREMVDLATELHGDGSQEQFDRLRDLYFVVDGEDPAAALAIAKRNLALQRAAHPDDYFTVYAALGDQVDVLVDLGRAEEAIASLEAVLGSDVNRAKANVFADPAAYRRATSLAFDDPFGEFETLNARLAILLLDADKDDAAALEAARMAATGHRGYLQSLGFSEADQKLYEQALLGTGFLANLHVAGQKKFELLADALWQRKSAVSDADREAFSALQDAMTSGVTLAVGRSAARDLLKNAGVANLLEERDRLLAESDAASSNLNTQRDLTTLARARDKRAQVDLELRKAAPGFFRLMRPEALPLAEVQDMLGPNEAIVLLVPTSHGTHAMAVTREGLVWHRSDLDSGKIGALVAALREDLDPAGSKIPPPWFYIFRRTLAYQLYTELLMPLHGALKGKDTLYFALSGDLARLPPGVLVTAPPEGDDDDLEAMRTTHWLIDDFAVVQIPSVQSLRFLREKTTGEKSSIPASFAGFGDPVLEGKAATRGAFDGTFIDTRVNPFRGGSLADIDSIAQLSRLPGTATELEAIRSALHASKNGLFLGRNATETMVKQTDLSHVGILAFATHGLLAGEIDSVVEPGLVFTPPEEATEMDDGLLTASEVMQLSLSADWVILSACNTAGGEGTNAEALSGLARTFFYAGAKSLLASHWQVRDDMAALLSSRTVLLRQEDPSISRAEALRRTMIDIRKNSPDETAAHPSSWAPFVVVGDAR
ncbi:CHAT domain-containing protein [Novosphingobium mangrovi (ex Huang et al. 2023)]|uniref:CHAT domain-containing protein n=1 Tax=Novosphingobium mangrovi (ex Huang et al. 2023) TaxID=2976432 RepID=A0ABT2I969_9SPHN|nr:CHAT domain-containing protein [Novosphingobium mangrovi (ex Huang et al. 2023)]MCT2401386.1 CHAT domain-containing protein [Novosphingobium mangrovi (ex Huang et al. 2023)]